MQLFNAGDITIGNEMTVGEADLSVRVNLLNPVWGEVPTVMACCLRFRGTFRHQHHAEEGFLSPRYAPSAHSGCSLERVFRWDGV